MRQNQPQVDGRTHTTNTPHQGTPGQRWMSARAMSAHFFTSLHPCLTQSGTYDGVESRGWSDTHSHCSAQFTSLITPNISIERPDAHLADGPTQDVAMANHRPYLRFRLIPVRGKALSKLIKESRPRAGGWRCCTIARRRDETSINTSVSPQPVVIPTPQATRNPPPLPIPSGISSISS